MGITYEDTVSLPVTWDPAHLLNLTVTDVKDKDSLAGSYFRLFIKRSNIFNHLLSRGKGFAFLQLLDQNAHRPVSYTDQRFASSYGSKLKRATALTLQLLKLFIQITKPMRNGNTW